MICGLPSTKTSKIARINPAGIVTEYALDGVAFPACITQGPDGNLWFTEQQSAAIGKISTSGIVTEYPLPNSGEQPYGITAGPDGNIWFTVLSGNIGKITMGGTVTEYTCHIPSTGGGCIQAHSITAGPDGNLWFTPQFSDELGVMTTNGVASAFGFIGSPMSITNGPDGNLWVAFRRDAIYKVTPGVYAARYPLHPGVPLASQELRLGPDNNLWFTEQYSDIGAQVVRITTSGTITGFPLGSYAALPMGITAGPDGNIWFVETGVNKIGVLVLSKVTTPSIAAVVNAASFSSGAVSPGEIVTIAGSGLGPASGVGLALSIPLEMLRTSLGGVSVSFNGYSAPLVYVSQNQ